MKTIATPNPVVLLMLGLWVVWGFGIETVVRRLQIEVDGVIISSRDTSPTREPRYATQYILRADDGRETSYVAGATDASLPRSLPVGTRLTKQKWRLDYEKNGQNINDFPIGFYAIVGGIGLASLLWSFLIWRDRRRSKNVSPSS